MTQYSFEINFFVHLFRHLERPIHIVMTHLENQNTHVERSILSKNLLPTLQTYKLVKHVHYFQQSSNKFIIMKYISL